MLRPHARWALCPELPAVSCGSPGQGPLRLRSIKAPFEPVDKDCMWGHRVKKAGRVAGSGAAAASAERTVVAVARQPILDRDGGLLCL